MPALPTLALARMIVKAYNNDDFLPVIVEGGLRRGKSAYAIKVISQVLEYLGRKPLSRWNLRSVMGWEPRDVIETWLLKGEKKEPVFCWDDAGVWLNNCRWNDPLLLTISEYLNLVGTDYGCLILTTPKAGWVLSKINAIPELIRIKIRKSMGTDNIDGNDEPSVRFARQAVGYKPWRSPDLKQHGVNKILLDDYSCKIPDDIYQYYKPLREGYNAKVKKKMLGELNAGARKVQLRDLQQDTKYLRWTNQLRKLQAQKNKLQEKDLIVDTTDYEAEVETDER